MPTRVCRGLLRSRGRRWRLMNELASARALPNARRAPRSLWRAQTPATRLLLLACPKRRSAGRPVLVAAAVQQQLDCWRARELSPPRRSLRPLTTRPPSRRTLCATELRAWRGVDANHGWQLEGHPPRPPCVFGRAGELVYRERAPTFRGHGRVLANKTSTYLSRCTRTVGFGGGATA
eukprot:scaffold233665_cov23-Tisochrysis_lutea.AAC.1